MVTLSLFTIKFPDSWPQGSTAGANTFSNPKNEASKCCDILFDLLRVKMSSEKQVKRGQENSAFSCVCMSSTCICLWVH